jgi:hypothetical protein
MHRVKIKLYPNYLPKGEGTFLARTDSEAALGINQVVAAMIERGGFKGDPDIAAATIRAFMQESSYQLCDGYTVNLDLFSLYFNVGGVFKTEHDTPDPKANPLTLRIRAHGLLAKLLKATHIQIEGFANTNGCIDVYIDEELGDAGHLYVKGHMFTLIGEKIQITGDPALVGLYFVPVDDPSAAVKVTRIMENHPHKIIGIAPDTGHQYCRLEVRTQFSGATATLLKAPRTIVSPFVLEEA